MNKVIILFDTEYTSWEGSMERNWSHKNEYKELVQLSAIKINIEKNNIKIIDKITIVCKPVKNPILSEYFIKLTGITNNDIENGVSFNNCLVEFYTFCKYNNKQVNIYSYGNDYNILEINMKYNDIPINSKFYKWKKKFYDIKPIFSLYGINTHKYTSV